MLSVDSPINANTSPNNSKSSRAARSKRSRKLYRYKTKRIGYEHWLTDLSVGRLIRWLCCGSISRWCEPIWWNKTHRSPIIALILYRYKKYVNMFKMHACTLCSSVSLSVCLVVCLFSNLRAKPAQSPV